MKNRRLIQTGAALCLALLLPAVPPASAEFPPECPPGAVEPYVFFLFDTSGSMSWSPPCTQTQLDNGECSFLCPTGDCYVPLQADDPASKLYQVKQALYEALADHPWGFHFGFASFNQDQMRARAKHWLYEAAGPGVSIPGWGAYPATGSREVFGFLWGCDTGSGDHEIGCLPTKPADLSDVWELTRMQRLPKGGQTFTQTVTFYVRHAGVTYRVRNVPLGGFQLGGTIQSDVRVDRCMTSSCSTVTATGAANVSWTPVSDFLSWDNADISPARTNPMQSYFSQPAALDADLVNSCGGWDPNTDSSSDLYSGYNLRWPTISDPRGPFLASGDVLPWDWQNNHRDDISARLAPNTAGNPTATPDFRTAAYLQNYPVLGQSYTQLKNASQRPLIASGSTPHARSLDAVRIWYSGWKAVAEQNDPQWLCRRKAVVILTDGDENCAADPCAAASHLLLNQGLYTFVIGYGVNPLGSQLHCIAAQGGTGQAFFPQTPGELHDALDDVLDATNYLSGVIVRP